MGRKNKRKKSSYFHRMWINPKELISKTQAHSNGALRECDDLNPRRGDIWFADLGSHPGTSVQGGCRPVIIVSNDIGNYHAETLNILPITRHKKKPDLPCHTEIDPAFISDLQQNFDISMILAEQITTIDKSQLRNYVGCVEDKVFLESINTSICGQLGLSSDPRLSSGETESETTMAEIPTTAEEDNTLWPIK